MNKTSSKRAGLPLIKQAEGCRLVAYVCPAGVLTIGWGRTTDVKAGDTCTQEQADTWLIEEYDRFESGVLKLVTVELSENQKGALTSWAYDVGLGNASKSTLLRKVNRQDWAGAASEFSKWALVNGKRSTGLVKRRSAECRLFKS